MWLKWRCAGAQIRVFCRVRPAPDSAVACSNDGASLRLSAEDGKEHAFSFDAVFGPTANQADIFSQVSDMVQSALDGYKVRSADHSCRQAGCRFEY